MLNAVFCVVKTSEFYENGNKKQCYALVWYGREM